MSRQATQELTRVLEVEVDFERKEVTAVAPCNAYAWCVAPKGVCLQVPPGEDPVAALPEAISKIPEDDWHLHTRSDRTVPGEYNDYRVISAKLRPINQRGI